MEKSIHSERQKRLQDLLRKARLEAGLTQVTLAAKLDVPKSRISDYEQGGRRLDLVQLQTYCEAMNITLREFVDRFDS